MVIDIHSGDGLLLYVDVHVAALANVMKFTHSTIPKREYSFDDVVRFIGAVTIKGILNYSVGK